MSPDLFHAIMDRAQVEKRFPSVMLSLSAHDCHEIREVIADRDRLRSELDAARAELARARLAYIRQIERRAAKAAKHCDEWAQVIRSIGCWDPRSYQGRRLTRIRKVRDACRAELARMEAQ